MDPITIVTQAPESPAWRQGIATVSDAVKSPQSDEKVKYDLGSGDVKGLERKVASETEKDDSDELRQVQEAAEEANEALVRRHVSLSFRVDDKSDCVVVQVIESDSGKVIRQIPPDEVLAMRSRLADMTGLIVDREV
jgi:flagellar protein FlaG